MSGTRVFCRRAGTFRDVILDSSAGLLAQIALFAILRTQRFRMGKSVLPKVGIL
jgi:hypothetical protein